MELVAINHGDSADLIKEYVDKNKFSFLVGMGGAPGGKDYGIFEQYGVQAYPTNYVLDENGKVIWRGVGFDEEAVRTALRSSA